MGISFQLEIFIKSERKELKCLQRNLTSSRMLPRSMAMPTTTLVGLARAPPAKSQKPKGALSLAPGPENDRNRRNARRQIAEKADPLAHAVVQRAVPVEEKAVPSAAPERAVPGAVEEKAAPRAVERADLRPESRPTASVLIKSRLTTSRATSVICARIETSRDMYTVFGIC